MDNDDYDMPELGAGHGGEAEEDEEISPDLWQEACWIVISAYFDEKGKPKYIVVI